MLRYVLLLLAVSAVFAATPVYEISGRLVTPEHPKRPFRARTMGSATLSGAASPFSVSTWIDLSGHFKFKRLQPGTYMLVVSIRTRGEARQTVEVGPGTSDRHHRVWLALHLRNADFVRAPDLRRFTVSVKEATIPNAALRDFERAQKDLSHQDVTSAVKRLEDAVERAPQFSAAWNNLGTIAYQSQNYARAEECFRQALAQDPQSYEALVNLGGVLVTLHKLDEALDRNVQAVALRDNDALAQSQLGMTYYLLGNFDLAKKHLERARAIDPAHFSHPQLILAEIDVREGNPRAAAAVLDDFLAHHPDWPQAATLRKTIAQLRSR